MLSEGTIRSQQPMGSLWNDGMVCFHQNEKFNLKTSECCKKGNPQAKKTYEETLSKLKLPPHNLTLLTFIS